MIGILLVTHGSFANGLKNAVELIAGKQTALETVSLYHGDSLESFRSKIANAINNLNTGDGVLVFADILGGSPSNEILKLLAQNKFYAIAGVNMPMLCHAVLSRNSINDIKKLQEQCLTEGQKAQVSLNNILCEIQSITEDDF